MKRRAIFILGTYAAGFVTGGILACSLIFQHGEIIGAWVIGKGARLTNAGTVPYWSLAISPDEDMIRTPPPALKVAAKK